MIRENSQRAYQQVSVLNANPVELVIILYDMIGSDLQGALDAVASKDVERRVAKLKHAFLALQQLECMLDAENGGETARILSKFYAMMRGRIMQVQFSQDPAALEEILKLLTGVRDAWVEFSHKLANPPQPESFTAKSLAPNTAGIAQEEVVRLSISI